MKWILKLYPRAWRERYGPEMAAYIDESRPGKFRTTLDLFAGAVDAWSNADLPEPKGEVVTAWTRCEPLEISRSDEIRSAIWMLGTTFALTAVGVALDKLVGDSVYFRALIYSSMFIGFTVSSRQTFLKPYSRTARNVIVIVSAPGWYLFFLGMMVLTTSI